MSDRGGEILQERQDHCERDLPNVPVAGRRNLLPVRTAVRGCRCELSHAGAAAAGNHAELLVFRSVLLVLFGVLRGL